MIGGQRKRWRVTSLGLQLFTLCFLISVPAARSARAQPSTGSGGQEAIVFTMNNRTDNGTELALRYLKEGIGIDDSAILSFSEDELRKSLPEGVTPVSAVLDRFDKNVQVALTRLSAQPGKSKELYISIVSHGGDGKLMAEDSTDAGVTYESLFKKLFDHIDQMGLHGSISVTVLIDACSSYSAQPALEARTRASASKAGAYSNGDRTYNYRVRLIAESDKAHGPKLNLSAVALSLKRFQKALAVLDPKSHCPDWDFLALNDHARDVETVGPTTWSSYDPLPEIRRTRLSKAQAFELARRALVLPPEETLPPEGVDSQVSADLVQGTVTGLVRFGRDSIPILEKALTHWSPFVRREAMLALSHLEGAKALPWIAKMASTDSAHWLRAFAIYELESYPKSAIGKYEKEIAKTLGARRTENMPYPGNAAAHFLRCYAPQGLELLESAAKSTDSLVIEDAQFGLSEICN